jgi:pimeloyl-ACP methyl ester carboxylesterase
MGCSAPMAPKRQLRFGCWPRRLRNSHSLPTGAAWQTLRRAAGADALFALPAQDYAWGTTASLTEPSSFINIARRVRSDESYRMDQALAKLATRTLVIMGSHDQVVSNDLASSALKQICRTSITKAVLTGSGHYIHDLQYHYFRLLLTEFL